MVQGWVAEHQTQGLSKRWRKLGAQVSSGQKVRKSAGSVGPALSQDKMVAGVRNTLVLLDEPATQDKLVAGVGFEPTTFRL